MGKKFDFKDTAVAKTAEEIRDDNQHTSMAPTAAPVEVSGETSTKFRAKVAEVSRETLPVADATTSTVKAKKATNGIVIDVPMQEYIQLTMMKVQTGRTLKDLALQAIREFVERNGGVG